MALPRRFDRRPPERDTTRINDRIRVREVRLIGDDGSQIGVLPTDEALKYAQERDLDLVEVAPEAKPPVCRVLDYSKYKYEQAQKAKSAKKHQQQITIREIKLRPKIAVHDYDTKKGHVVRFLKHADKVKVTIMFRGREREHPERGRDLLMKLAEEVQELGTVEQTPLLEGRNMTMVLGPTKEAIKQHSDEVHAHEEALKAARVKRKAEEAAAHAARVAEAEAETEAEVASENGSAESAASPVASVEAPAESDA
ncbi:MAG: translation initiation factor IF-3 [Actinobacteria bacterium]|nr:translation initiation factor IF-3 [Actinomycetota bacterium]